MIDEMFAQCPKRDKRNDACRTRTCAPEGNSFLGYRVNHSAKAPFMNLGKIVQYIMLLRFYQYVYSVLRKHNTQRLSFVSFSSEILIKGLYTKLYIFLKETRVGMQFHSEFYSYKTTGILHIIPTCIYADDLRLI